MRKSDEKYIEVYADWIGLNQPVLAGLLHATALKKVNESAHNSFSALTCPVDHIHI